MKIKAIESNEAPQAIGPYSQAIKANDFLFVSGQLPIDPETGKFVEGDMRDLTNRVLDNIEAILKEAGLKWDHVVRAEIFLKNLAQDFAAVNEEYAKRFQGDAPPARQTVQVADLPLGSPIEISCIAVTSEP